MISMAQCPNQQHLKTIAMSHLYASRFMHFTLTEMMEPQKGRKATTTISTNMAMGLLWICSSFYPFVSFSTGKRKPKDHTIIVIAIRPESTTSQQRQAPPGPSSNLDYRLLW